MNDGSNPYVPPPESLPADPSYDPYAPPSAQIGAAGGDLGEAEAIRRQYLQHEALIRSVGCLYLWGGVLTLVITALGLVALPFYFLAANELSDTVRLMGISLLGLPIYGGLGALNYWIGKGLRRLDPKVRTITTILLMIGLLGFPFGTALSLCFLYLLHSEKGRKVMTEEYQKIVEQTPHIEYKTSWVAWLALALIAAGFVTWIVTTM